MFINSHQDMQPNVEIHVNSQRMSAAASGEIESKLSDEQLRAIQITISKLVQGFCPQPQDEKDSNFKLSSIKLTIGFKLEIRTGSAIKLILDSSSEASISTTCEWNKEK
jgi:hypothetical protein